MKIAIQGHPTKGKEVIQILESLGGKNAEGLEGTYETFYYIDDKNEIGDDHKKNFPSTYKFYTLEEFPKIGDKVTFLEDDHPYTIKSFDIWSDGDLVCEFEENGLHYSLSKLKLYKEMQEERNITLTLDKAKEWYKKGGELKEIALQAFSEKELTKIDLPKTWEKFCENYPVKKGECWIGSQDASYCATMTQDRRYKNWIPSKKSAEAHLAMIQLEQLRDCWRQGWKPNWLDGNTKKYAIKGWRDKSSIEGTYVTSAFLSFPTYELALEFLECFRDLIEKAGDLI